MTDPIDKRSRAGGPDGSAGGAGGRLTDTQDRLAAGTDPEPFASGVGSRPTAIEMFGPYLVYECLGQGGMATVHRAEKRGVGIRRPVALKRLLPHVAADPELVKLFVDEARLASHLRHANVAQTYELGRVGTTFFIAMEYASGPTLTQIARQCQSTGTRVPIPIAVNILSQVCEALDHAHNLCDESGSPLHLIHRDVSPANLIVTNTGIVKLIDFGIAKATTSSVKTQTGFIKGKFGYIAPEYITGRIDARVDLFALGVIAHEMLAGRRLFEGKDDFETMSNIRDMVVLPPSRWNPEVTPDLDDIVLTALERDPENRWRSASAMQVALNNVARALGVVVGNQQLVEWVEWVFNQEPSDSGGWADPGSSETSVFDRAPRRPSDSVSIELRLSPSDLIEVLTPPPEPRPRRGGSASDSVRTVPFEYVQPPLGDFELLTPPPVAPAPVSSRPLTPRSSSQIDAVAPLAPRSSSPLAAVEPLPSAPRSSSQIEAVAPRSARPSRPFETAGPRPGTPTLEDIGPVPPASATFEALPPPPPRPSRAVEAARPSQVVEARPSVEPPPALLSKTLESLPPPPPLPQASRLDAMVPLVPPLREVSVIVVPPERMFKEPTPLPIEPEPPRLKPRSRSARATQDRKPEPRGAEPGPTAARTEPAREAAAGTAGRAVWTVVLMLALGAAAAAAAYYGPDLIGQ